jgi:hypothetical protein
MEAPGEEITMAGALRPPSLFICDMSHLHLRVSVSYALAAVLGGLL